MAAAGWRDLGELKGPVMLFGGPYSNLQATQALRSEAARRGVAPGRAICTGDVAAYCGQPQRTVAAIRRWGCPVVAGNCEEQLAGDASDCGCGFAAGSVCDALSAEWYAYASARMRVEDRLWMAGLPRRLLFSHRGRRWAVIHGAASDVSRFVWPGEREVMAEEIALLEDEAGPLDGVIAGHCGLPFVEEIGERTWVNAGVIGMPPHDGRPDTAFAMLDEGVTLHRLVYDAAGAAGAMAGRDSPYAEALTSGWWPSEDVLPEAMRRNVKAA